VRAFNILLITVAIVGITGVSVAVTPQKEPVSVALTANKLTQNAQGITVAQPVTKVKPNDVIEYRAVYTNNTGKAIKNLTATLPIPPATQFLAKSTPSATLASTDGVNFAAMPLKRKVGNQIVNVPLQDYRALRWTIAEVPAGKSVSVSAQTRVNSVTP